jgi:5-methylcytosine-specific restriction endonuclease McrA
MTMPKSKDPRDSRQWRAKRIAILQRDGYTCGYCGQPADTVDHILPVKDHPDQAMSNDNLIAACKTCNSRKGSRSHASFLGGAFAPPVFPAVSLSEMSTFRPDSPFDDPDVADCG